MIAEIIAPYSKYYGQEFEVVSVEVSNSIFTPHIAKVKIKNKELTFTTDELRLSEEDKARILKEHRRRILQ